MLPSKEGIMKDINDSNIAHFFLYLVITAGEMTKKRTKKDMKMKIQATRAVAFSNCGKMDIAKLCRYPSLRSKHD